LKNLSKNGRNTPRAKNSSKETLTFLDHRRHFLQESNISAVISPSDFSIICIRALKNLPNKKIPNDFFQEKVFKQKEKAEKFPSLSLLIL
jgi:hypothetical protein